MLEQEMKDKEEEQEQQKENLKAVEDEKTETPGIQGSDNKERRKKTQATVKGTSVLEVNSSSKGENTTLLEGRRSGHKDGTDKDNKQAASDKNNKEHVLVRTNGEKISNNRLEANTDLDRDNNRDRESIMERIGSDLVEEDEESVKRKHDTEKDEDMEYNIQQISKEGDLSPRHTNSLKRRARKGRQILPFQVQTRSSKERATHSDQ
ncbi:hypothetical protein KY290_017076 [Solanum tuberosum]|uniref:Uncharacterized protein n=1 Tax=Solanum tuberosum TaxID=4113 RepID=A0ABQ7VCF0_SOLTU|nr:hypothetical protein KY284_016143 [Solanum tuberosum]KAH0701860.1 hypothetical protein KY285_016138 [Solanum tuberosum]KAH0761003.1 hypothetical protein KY290_017076 [Solanum tuberosum]